MASQRPRAYFETLEGGLAHATDLVLANSAGLDEVKELVYGRYREEDKRHRRCDAQRRELRAQMASVASLAAAYYREPKLTRPVTAPKPRQTTPRTRTTEANPRPAESQPRPTASSDDRSRRLVNEMRALQHERVRMIMHFAEECRAMQDMVQYQVIATIEDIRAQQAQTRSGTRR